MKLRIRLFAALLFSAVLINLCGCYTPFDLFDDLFSPYRGYEPNGYSRAEEVFSEGFRDFTWYYKYYYTADDVPKFSDSEKYHRVREKDLERLERCFETIGDAMQSYALDNPDAPEFDFDLGSITTDDYYVEFHNQNPIEGDYDKQEIPFYISDFDVMLFDSDTLVLHWIHFDT